MRFESAAPHRGAGVGSRVSGSIRVPCRSCLPRLRDRPHPPLTRGVFAFARGRLARVISLDFATVPGRRCFFFSHLIVEESY